MKKFRMYAQGLLVERSSAGSAPSAFRIWQAGRNDSDDGPVFFTDRSAELIVSEQSSRGRLYSFDYDHLSVQSDRPASAGRAAGWHRLEVRAGDLWAVDIEWCAEAKEGIEQSPPLWRYFSPAFYVNAEQEVIGYTNCALCINPKTHGIQSLASTIDKRRGETMDPKQLLALLTGLTVPDEQKDALASAIETLKSMIEGDAQAAAEIMDKEPEAEKKETSYLDVKEEKEKAASSTDSEKVSSALAFAIKQIADLKGTVTTLEKDKYEKQFAELVSTHKGITPEISSTLRGMPLEKVRAIIASIKVPSADKPTSPTTGDVHAVRMAEIEAKADVSTIDRVLRTRKVHDTATPTKIGLHRDPQTGQIVLHAVTPSQMRRVLEERAKKGV
jgi:Mu-like prophage I protein